MRICMRCGKEMVERVELRMETDLIKLHDSPGILLQQRVTAESKLWKSAVEKWETMGYLRVAVCPFCDEVSFYRTDRRFD